MKLTDAEMTDAIRCALARHFEDTQRYVLLEEVGNATGYRNRGWADAVCLHLWPSDGLKLWGFEVKASRTDWKKEIANPKKSENIARFCDRWIVVAPKGLVRDGELPAAWGLWEYDPEKETLNFRAKGEERKPSKYLHRGFFASLIRRAGRTMPAASYVAMVTAAANAQAERRYRRMLDDEAKRTAAQQKTLDQVHRALRAAGFQWNEWLGTVEPLPSRS